MADLNTDVRYIKGIGEKKAQALNKLGVFSLYDLISYFPRKYEDRSVYKPIALTADGETVCVCALVADTPRLTRIRRGLDIVKLRAVDESGVLDVTFFNQSYAKDNLHRGESYIFYGKIEAHGARRAMTEKPAETPPMMPPISHVLVDTRPMDAEAFAPSAPTIAESIYCMAIVVICVSIAGRLNRQTSRACAFSSGIVSLFISSSGPRRFY